jgi:hypothetical protein
VTCSTSNTSNRSRFCRRPRHCDELKPDNPKIIRRAPTRVVRSRASARRARLAREETGSSSGTVSAHAARSYPSASMISSVVTRNPLPAHPRLKSCHLPLMSRYMPRGRSGLRAPVPMQSRAR